MDTPNQIPSLTEKHNAMISYCFLAPFMLLSGQEQFRSNFVRNHARYGSILHIGFLILIISFIRSRNFSSTIIYDTTWVHWILFVLFFILLFLLGSGIFSALKGEKPRIALNAFSIKSFEKEFSTEITVSIEEKTPLILSHIPFLGIYLSAKYGGKLVEWEKFGNWLFVALICAIMLDPSMTLFIIMIILVIFWLVCQWIGTEKDTTVHLLGDKLWGGEKAHIYTQSIVSYTIALFRHEKNMPSFSHIHEEAEKNYNKKIQEKCSPIVYVPIVNLVHLFRFRKEAWTENTRIQWLILSILALYGLLFGSFSIFWLAVFAWFWGYNQCHFQKNSYIPLVGECADNIIKFIQWKKKKSVSEEVHLTTHQ